ncbi:MAG TPA: glycine cleavage T C-terminal barrel domain-containing protein [Roseiflexaceae bacterium]|nr:glycine cleavage T C-terminal barrel domain-containing protein [Roseiflexaceae bacterium]
MNDTLDIPLVGYRAALDGAALADERTAGRVFMRGRDRAALLHRLSTNDIARLKPGQGARTVLTTPIGRIIDLLTVHVLEDALLIVTSPGQGGPVWAHLKKNIFFNDQVTLEAAGRSHGQIAVYGAGAAGLLERVSGAVLSELRPHHTAPIELAGVPTLAAGREPIGAASFTLYPPMEQFDLVWDALTAAGAVTLDAAALDILRVERGYGAFGRELSQEYIPLETGLLDAVSFTKGCYVGQEIIARMESRGRLAKMLRGLRLTMDDGRQTMDDASSIVHRLSSIVPAKLEVEGKEAGDLTSVVVSPRFGPIGLAYVRSAHAAPGSIVGVAGSAIRGEVVELPFDRLG